MKDVNFWLSVLNDLKNRDIRRFLIACIDRLTGFSQEIQAAFPRTESQPPPFSLPQGTSIFSSDN